MVFIGIICTREYVQCILLFRLLSETSQYLIELNSCHSECVNQDILIRCTVFAAHRGALTSSPLIMDLLIIKSAPQQEIIKGCALLLGFADLVYHIIFDKVYHCFFNSKFLSNNRASFVTRNQSVNYFHHLTNSNDLLKLRIAKQISYSH